MRDFAPEQFDKFAGFLFASYAKKGLSVRHAVHQEMMAHQSLKYDEAYEEVVARLSESFLRDAHLSEKSKALYNADKSLWQSIKDGLEKVINKIKESFADISPDSRLGKIGQKMVRENQDILDRFVSGIREAADNAAYIEKTTDEGGDTRMEMAREIETITDERAEELLEYAEYGEYDDNTYIPMRKDTPTILINSTKGLESGEISDRPMLIPVGKARQSLTPEGEYYKGDNKGHGFERYQIVSAIRNLDNPKRLFFEKEYDRYAALVSYEDSKGNLALIPLDVDQNINPVYLNGFKGGIYNISVSVFNQEDIESYVNNDDHVEIEIKREDDSQRGSSGQALSHLNESSSTDDIIPDSSEKSNTSDKKRLEQSRDDGYLSAVNRGDMETAQRMVDEAAERAFADSKIRGAVLPYFFA